MFPRWNRTSAAGDRETRRHGATHIIAVLSSNFVQRGDVALLNKFDRAQLAVKPEQHEKAEAKAHSREEAR